ncbi:uncharacterized protein LOC143581224 [Bidens hawaiensis]|uniref:uncharacterized protein LOC143581224 n=1 Tax=Bidens hawaiensis TaxID=980011 RepID=UPI00404A9F69
MDATMPGFEPLQVLTPTLAECATDWWRASRQFFDGFANDYSPPLNKKARVSFQTHSSVKVRDQLEDDIAITTTMSSSNTATSHRSTGCRETVERTMLENKLQKPLVVTCLTSLEEHVDELQKARQPHCVKTEMLTPSDRAEDRVVAGKVSSQSDIICFQGYKVKQSVASILESIFNKHGDIAADCVFKSASVRSSFLEIVCEVASQIQTDNDIDKIEEIEKQVLVTEAANINVSWLRAHMETVHKRREASKKCSSLMEMKATTILVKKAAILDLRESCVELMAAQEQFKKAERCVRVLHLVEQNLDNKILESKVI